MALKYLKTAVSEGSSYHHHLGHGYFLTLFKIHCVLKFAVRTPKKFNMLVHKTVYKDALRPV